MTWYYRTGPMVFLALFALGPFVLPLIWRSPRLGDKGRWIGTGLVVLLSLYLAYSLKRSIELAMMVYELLQLS